MMMTDTITEEEIIDLGMKAQELIDNDNYIELFEKVSEHLALAILATNALDTKLREDLFMTYNGMRDFASRINAFIAAKDDIARQRNEAKQDIDY